MRFLPDRTTLEAYISRPTSEANSLSVAYVLVSQESSSWDSNLSGGMNTVLSSRL